MQDNHCIKQRLEALDRRETMVMECHTVFHLERVGRIKPSRWSLPTAMIKVIDGLSGNVRHLLQPLTSLSVRDWQSVKVIRKEFRSGGRR